MTKFALPMPKVFLFLIPHLLGCAVYWFCYNLYIRQAFLLVSKHYHNGVLCGAEHLFEVEKSSLLPALVFIVAASFITAFLFWHTVSKNKVKKPKAVALLPLGFLPTILIAMLYSYCFDSRGSWWILDALFYVTLTVSTALYIIFTVKNKESFKIFIPQAR